MIIFFLSVACIMSGLGYAIGILIMAALGNPIAKAIIWIFVIAMAVMMLLIYAIIG
jgi:hypothetical protein